jgi:hypothetical protein
MKIETTFPILTRTRSLTFVLMTVAAATLLATAGLRASDGQADQGRRARISPMERAMEANAQMREYRRRIEAQKYGANTLSSVQQKVSVKLNDAAQTSSTIFFYDKMEIGVNGWTTALYTGATDDLWHQTTLDASSATHSWWPGIEGSADYSTGNRINTAAITPPIDLTAGIAPLTLLFTENFYTERGWDYCMVDITTDGGSTWTPLRGVYGTAPSGDTEGWQATTLDLSAYAGSVVNIRFYFDTGDSAYNAFPGWFVDDVMVFDQGGMITGKKFFDVNSNGVKDIGERGVSDWYITADGPVTLTTRTNYRGRYWLTLPLGNYTVSEEHQAGWTQTYPPSGTWFLSLMSPDTLIDSVHFGNWRPAAWINGVKFHDLNRNGYRDAGDTLLPEWKVTLTDTNGVRIRFDKTDSLGVYGLPVFEPGTYMVVETDKPFWVQTYPPTERYTVTIPDLNTIVNLKDFGNYYSDSVNSIFGRKFNDLNRNGVYDVHEPGVAGFEMKLGGTKSRYRTTDDSGYYSFVGLPPGPYSVKEMNQDGWWPSLPALPETTYSLFLSPGTYVDTINFGNYQLAPGSISGTKWNDLNGDGIRDGGEPGLANWKINLAGKTTATTLTDANGDYTFTGLWPGDYTVSESWRPLWRQTYPPHLGTHVIHLGPEQDLTGVLFGNTADSSFSTTFRTFTYDSLALGKDLKNKTKPVRPLPNKVEFSAMFVNSETTSVSELFIKFTIAVQDSLGFDRPGILLLGGKNKIASFTLTTPMAVGETLTVHGFGVKPIPQNIRKWWWTKSNLVKGTVNQGGTFLSNVLRYPMPNTINLLEAVGGGLRVGMGGAHTVVHNNYKAVLKSLVERGFRLHLGAPRCLDRFEGTAMRPITRQQRYLMPKRHNNVLFAEAITLKVNIRGSDNLNMPPGFGDLIYDEGTGAALPLNGMSVREIAGLLDKYMSSFSDTLFNPSCSMIPEWAGLDVDTLYDRIRRINGSFTGPIDTVSFSTGLMFTGVGSINDVPYLRLDTSSALRPLVAHEEIWGNVPDEFELSQNYPNPFNPTTTIEYYLPEDSYVTVTIYNALGQVVKQLVDNELEDAGYLDLTVDASQLSSGVYFYRLAAKTVADPEADVASRTFSTVKKMVLMK